MQSRTSKLGRWKSAVVVGAAMAALAGASCEKEDGMLPEVKTYRVAVQLVYPDGYAARDSVSVRLTNNLTGGYVEAVTSASGAASFTGVAGTYAVSAGEVREDGYFRYHINGNRAGVVVGEQRSEADTVMLAMEVSAVPLPLEGDSSPAGKVVVKELYVGGCQKDDGSGAFSYDAYAILYNNSAHPASVKNLCFGGLFSMNAHAANSFIADGELSYAGEGWLPTAYGIFAIEQDVTLAAGEQLVVAFYNAVDNTRTYSRSVSFADKRYYCMYDPAVYTNDKYYVAPSEQIPASHYLKGYKFANATVNAWTVSMSSPAFIIFVPQGTTPAAFSSNVDLAVTHGASASQVARKTPAGWVVDGVEVFQKSSLDKSRKRLLPSVDAGHVELVSAQGYTLYRNVDRTATEAIAANAGKLVYGYAMGTDGITGVDGTTDPSGIDAEASMRNGARIVYMDTNNSTRDFHLRRRASLRSEQ